jgi:hypothetical protein
VLRFLDPANDKELGTVPEMGLAETKEAIDAASRAFKSWKNTTAKVNNVPRAARERVRLTNLYLSIDMIFCSSFSDLCRKTAMTWDGLSSALDVYGNLVSAYILFADP